MKMLPPVWTAINNLKQIKVVRTTVSTYYLLNKIDNRLLPTFYIKELSECCHKPYHSKFKHCVKVL